MEGLHRQEPRHLARREPTRKTAAQGLLVQPFKEADEGRVHVRRLLERRQMAGRPDEYKFSARNGLGHFLHAGRRRDLIVIPRNGQHRHLNSREQRRRIGALAQRMQRPDDSHHGLALYHLRHLAYDIGPPLLCLPGKELRDKLGCNRGSALALRLCRECIPTPLRPQCVRRRLGVAEYRGAHTTRVPAQKLENDVASHRETAHHGLANQRTVEQRDEIVGIRSHGICARRAWRHRSLCAAQIRCDALPARESRELMAPHSMIEWKSVNEENRVHGHAKVCQNTTRCTFTSARCTSALNALAPYVGSSRTPCAAASARARSPSGVGCPYPFPTASTTRT